MGSIPQRINEKPGYSAEILKFGKEGGRFTASIEIQNPFSTVAQSIQAICGRKTRLVIYKGISTVFNDEKGSDCMNDSSSKYNTVTEMDENYLLRFQERFENQLNVKIP